MLGSNELKVNVIKREKTNTSTSSKDIGDNIPNLVEYLKTLKIYTYIYI